MCERYRERGVERKGMYEREREGESMCVSERERGKEGEREGESMCVREREGGREGGREYVCE